MTSSARTTEHLRSGHRPRVGRSAAEEGQGNHADPIGPAVRRTTGCENHCINEVPIEHAGQPPKMADVAIRHRLGQLHLECHHALVPTDSEEIDLMLAAPGAQVRDGGFGRLGKDAHRLE